MPQNDIRRDFGRTWKARLEEARARAAAGGPPLSGDQIADLRSRASTADVSSATNMALLWSGRDILTEVPLDESAADGARWWDKLACREAEVFRALGIASSLEDTVGGTQLLDSRLNYKEDDPLFGVVQDLWMTLSRRFVEAAAGRIEIIAEGAFDEGVFKTVELAAVLSNGSITAINGLDRIHFPSGAADAFALLRRWDVERSRRYSQFIASSADSTPYERAAALDDFREIQLWFEHDFFDDLGPDRELPALPDEVVRAADRTHEAGAWKYADTWRQFIRQSEEEF